jgi:hypothetical protein
VNLVTLQEFFDIVSDNSGILAIVAAILLSLIEITPIKLNPLSWLGKKIGRLFNGELMNEVSNVKQEVKSIKQDVTDIRAEAKEREATNRRTRILEFGDEILHGVDYSKEHFDQILLDVTAYENYCDEHPHYMNNVARATIEHIKHVYKKHLQEDSFLK